MTDKILEVGVTSVYEHGINGAEVLSKFCASFQPGVNIILGDNGVGKTTLFRCIANVHPGFEGTVSYNNQMGHTLDPGTIEFCQQKSEDLLPWRTAIANVNLPRELTGLGRDCKAEDILSELGLPQRKHATRVKFLSGGQKARVAIARSLASNAKIVLLDEPCAAIDMAGRIKIYKTIRTMAEQHELTVLLSTHDTRDAVWSGDMVYLLRKKIVNGSLETELKPIGIVHDEERTYEPSPELINAMMVLEKELLLELGHAN